MIRLPKAHKDWRRILAKAWSVKMLVLAMALTALQVYLEFTSETGQNVALTIFTGVVTAAAFGTRLLAQTNMESDDGTNEKDPGRQERAQG
jgi:hypothetical protein